MFRCSPITVNRACTPECVVTARRRDSGFVKFVRDKTKKPIPLENRLKFDHTIFLESPTEVTQLYQKNNMLKTFEIMADKKLMRQIKQADLDWASGTKDSYVSGEDLKNV